MSSAEKKPAAATTTFNHSGASQLIPERVTAVFDGVDLCVGEDPGDVQLQLVELVPEVSGHGLGVLGDGPEQIVQVFEVGSVPVGRLLDQVVAVLARLALLDVGCPPGRVLGTSVLLAEVATPPHNLIKSDIQLCTQIYTSKDMPHSTNFVSNQMWRTYLFFTPKVLVHF